jgi:hypothetical protein
MTIVYFVLVAIVGIAVGAVSHAAIEKDIAASKSEVAGWAQELRNTLVTDAEAAKVKVQALILKLEAKL